MKITIITVVFNGAHTISDCIESVLSQDYGDVEYIIIDGNSTDDTLKIIERYGSSVQRVVSEPDRGIYDAMNKGVRLATGDVIGILNADDVYASSEVLTEVAGALLRDGTDAVYGDLVYTDQKDRDKVVRKWISGAYKKGSFRRGWMPPHPTFFIRSSFYSQYGSFRTDLGSAADYELMLRMIEKHGVSLSYVKRVLVKMRSGGVSNQSLANRWEANRNDLKAWKLNGLKPGLFTLIIKPLRKVFQFLV